MATANEVLPLDRMKRELAIPDSANDHDALLEDHIAAAVDFCARLVDLDVADLDADEIPLAFIQASVVVGRMFYDGFIDWRMTNALYHLLRPLRKPVALVA